MLPSSLSTVLADIYHDTVFQLIVVASVTVLAAVIGSFITILFARRQQQRKIIACMLVSQAPIASINKDVEDRVEILYDGKPVIDVTLLVFKIWNYGNVAVRVEDYNEPITLSFGEGHPEEEHTIVGSDILETEPQNLIDPEHAKISIHQTPYSITLPNLLLNPKDTIMLKVLLTGYEGSWTVKARIVDGNIFGGNLDNRPITIKITIAVLLTILIDLLLVIIGTVPDLLRPYAPPFDFSGVIVVTLLFLSPIFILTILGWWFVARFIYGRKITFSW